MKDYIKYSGDNLAAASSQLGRLSNTMSDVADMLSAVDTSAGWWTKIGLRTSYGDVRDTVQAGRRNASAIRQKTENTISGIRKTRETFDEVERNIDLGGTGTDQSVYQNSGNGVIVPSAETGAPATSTDKKTTSKFWEALVKAIGGTSGIGKIFEGWVGIGTSNDLISLGKGVTKVWQGIDKAVTDDIPKWVDAIQKSKQAKNIAENVGKAKQVADGAASAKWSFDTFANTFKDTFQEKFKTGIAKPMTWLFSGVLAVYDTVGDIQNHRYASTDDYVVKWASRTVADVAIKTTVNAGVTAAVTAGLTAAGIAVGGWVPIAAGAVTALTVYGGDCLVKWASKGTYSGMSDMVSDCAVKVWDNAKQNVKAKWQEVTTFWKSPIASLVYGN